MNPSGGLIGTTSAVRRRAAANNNPASTVTLRTHANAAPSKPYWIIRNQSDEHEWDDFQSMKLSDDIWAPLRLQERERNEC